MKAGEVIQEIFPLQYISYRKENLYLIISPHIMSHNNAKSEQHRMNSLRTWRVAKCTESLILLIYTNSSLLSHEASESAKFPLTLRRLESEKFSVWRLLIKWWFPHSFPIHQFLLIQTPECKPYHKPSNWLNKYINTVVCIFSVGKNWMRTCSSSNDLAIWKCVSLLAESTSGQAHSDISALKEFKHQPLSLTHFILPFNIKCGFGNIIEINEQSEYVYTTRDN